MIPSRVSSLQYNTHSQTSVSTIETTLGPVEDTESQYSDSGTSSGYSSYEITIRGNSDANMDRPYTNDVELNAVQLVAMNIVENVALRNEYINEDRQPTFSTFRSISTDSTNTSGAPFHRLYSDVPIADENGTLSTVGQCQSEYLEPTTLYSKVDKSGKQPGGSTARPRDENVEDPPHDTLEDLYPVQLHAPLTYCHGQTTANTTPLNNHDENRDIPVEFLDTINAFDKILEDENQSMDTFDTTNIPDIQLYCNVTTPTQLQGSLHDNLSSLQVMASDTHSGNIPNNETYNYNNSNLEPPENVYINLQGNIYCNVHKYENVKGNFIPPEKRPSTRRDYESMDGVSFQSVSMDSISVSSAESHTKCSCSRFSGRKGPVIHIDAPTYSDTDA